MSHKILVNGTIYKVKGGKCLVNGASYDIKKGRTLINGTGYDITFAPPPPMPVKGDLITMNLDGTSRLYRVLSINGNVCKVLGMWDDLTSKYNETSTTTIFGSTTAQKYEGSALDKYLNTTWYNTLSDTAKAAIVPENVVQYCYRYHSEPNTPNTPTYTYQYQFNWFDEDYENADNIGSVTIGNRNVFVLDLKDIFDYLDKVCITSDELMTMFWNSTTKIRKFLWLRSSKVDDSDYAWAVSGTYGGVGYNVVTNSNVVRPAFNINLSKIPFTIYSLPVKGDIVKLNLDGTEREYRVLSMNGSVGKIMGMWDDLTSKYNRTSTTTNFNGITAQKYEGSDLDTYLNTTWYNTLSSEAKNAIVPENVVQYCYRYHSEPNTPNTLTYTYQYQNNWSSSNYDNADNVGNVIVGERNVFALDLKDIFDYLEKVCITSDELTIMLWNSTTKVSKYLWLRSSYANNSSRAWSVYGYYGYLTYGNATNARVVRPALNIDMSKIQYTIV